MNCHAGAGSPTSYHILSTDASAWTPGGDFFWLTQSYTNTVRGGSVTSDPDNMGHNVVATDFSLIADGTNTVAPGGTYQASDLGCASCHDPHGQVAGRYGRTASSRSPYRAPTERCRWRVPSRATTGSWGRPGLSEPAPSINVAAPIASIPYATRFAETDASHPAYGQGMSEWCASCHGTYINDSHKHPSGNTEFLNGQAANYNSYVATGDFTGVQATAYTALVPFEHQETDRTVLLTAATSTAGPDSGNNVMCLTCHRAHASAFNNITRWDMEHELLAESLPSAANLTAMGAIPDSAYYGRDIATDFGDFQRSLCNKCHVQD